MMMVAFAVSSHPSYLLECYQDFMQTLTLNLQHGGAFDYPRSVSMAPTSTV